MTRHLYASPTVKPAAASSSPLAIQLAHRPPNLLPVEYDGLDLYQLAEDYTTRHGSYLFTEPKGLLVDGASVPRIAWSFAAPDGRHRRASFVHDVHYGRKSLPKVMADQMFFDMMIEDGVKRWRASLMYRAVHHFGNPAKSVLRWSVPIYPDATPDQPSSSPP